MSAEVMKSFELAMGKVFRDTVELTLRDIFLDGYGIVIKRVYD